MTALRKDLYVEQGADWPGEAFAIVDAVGNPRVLSDSMVATGVIGDSRDRPIFHWSNNPADDTVGRVMFVGQFYVPTLTKAQTELLTFRNAPYQLYLYDPAAPIADQDIRVGEGTLYLSRSIR